VNAFTIQAPDFMYLFKFQFCQIKLGKTKDKIAIHWQDFAQVGLQFKLAFRMRPSTLNAQMQTQVKLVNRS